MNRLGKGFFGQSYGWVYHVLSLKSCVAYFNSSILLGNYFTRLGSILLIALYWLGNCYIYRAQGWVTKIITQINISLQSQPEA